MKSRKQKEAERTSLEQQKAALQYFNEQIAMQKQQFEMIKPLVQQLISFGIDPVSFLQSAQGQALLQPLQEATAANFEGARTGLIDTLAGSGFSPQSGIGVGPLANLFGQEASQQSANIQNLIAQSLGLGIQGGNLAQGNIALFNPAAVGGVGNQAGQNVIFAPNPGQQLAMAGIGAAGSALGGLFGNPSFMAGGGSTGV